ncbi:tryptophan halogenase family protein [Sphingomonas sp. XXL09]|uniref:tryptophan halogenase family protein n=1 Tax=Sphingomonas sp. XXL09 TaxID=3457787 RepID=UPI00406BAA4C
MVDERVRVVVVGGGTAGWMTAAALAHMAPDACSVCLVESAEIGIVGVGEATLPHLRAFLKRLHVDEAQFMRATDATYKLGIEFCEFGRLGERYFHPFGSHGTPLGNVAFHHFWLRARAEGSSANLSEYGQADMASAACRFAQPEETENGPAFGWAYHFDATKLAPFLRGQPCSQDVGHHQGRIVLVHRDAHSGDVRAVELEDGRRIEGDLFIDCSGFRALLLDEEEWEDWSHWLPCDRAVALPSTPAPGPIPPFTRAHATDAGWRWRIPLRHRIGNGHVYASAFTDDDAACRTLLDTIEGKPLAAPRFLRFRAGRRRRSWVSNVVGVGLASGFLEPLESTSIYLVQAAITHLLEHFPARQITSADRDGFNTAIDAEYERIRDFLILHYHATTRDNSPFWNHVRTMPVPDTLRHQIDLWRESAHVARYGFGLFRPPSWIAVFVGQGILPDGWDPRADRVDAAALSRALAAARNDVAARVAAMPEHDVVLRQADR